MTKLEHGKNTRIVVVELKGHTIGFIVDEVSEVLRIPKSITEAPPDMVGGVDSDYITAIGKLEDRLLILLDLEKILSTSEFNVLETAA
jgi:purine-binding chemotaxis protein CheW